MLEAIVLSVRPLRTSSPYAASYASRVGRLAIRSLYREVALAPKPGLVSPVDTGSHSDMDMCTFLRSLFSLRAYFPAITAYGADAARFEALRALAIVAERRMLAATGGVNTHRGAIFNLGLICAAAGLLKARGKTVTADTACRMVSRHWGAAILESGVDSPPASHGMLVAQRYGSGGAREEAAEGFPAARKIGLPAYRTALAVTGSPALAATQALFALIAGLVDTNLLWRGGPCGLSHAQDAASDFLRRGGVLANGWRRLAADHDLHLAIVNGPKHMVLGGRQSALAAAATEALALGATRTVVLPVSTPSHTPLLATASSAFRAALAPWDQPGRLAFPVFGAIAGRAAYTRSAALDALAAQISTPLDWACCLSNLVETQPDRVLEVGPGNALARILEELAPGLPVRATSDFRSSEGILNWLH
ncbi:MAG: triphosphoribosyl-dephospho-CoA synthase [Candidatus Accumulibacter sp.]|uniref:triphosphoribosyl-dephospho-CoA synthase n=1 Tax=Candidatus Accumulibacter affinis TaxID=2954384 RepID=A0A935W5U5_9PROT|nr:triphosphoribosyl-dephospho-CoA synthase [Candidatus Accumulibacter affinis]